MQIALMTSYAKMKTSCANYLLLKGVQYVKYYYRLLAIQ